MKGPELNRHEWFLIEEALCFFWKKKLATAGTLARNGKIENAHKGRGKQYAEAKLKADQVKPLMLKVANHFD